jgi:outer membrane lipoprotein carrier protein
MEAEFTQVNDVAALKTKKTSSGVILVKRPNKLRWETHRPDMSILVSDGIHFWFYTPPFDEGEHGQVIERRSSEVQSRLANALLSGSFSIAREMKIKQESPSKFSLTPRTGTAGTVKRAEIEIDPALKIIQKVILEHRGGNRSEITLSKIILGKPIGDEIFVFIPPPNTDRVKE